MSQTSSGLEPVFRNSYVRRRKLSHDEEDIEQQGHVGDEPAHPVVHRHRPQPVVAAGIRAELSGQVAQVHARQAGLEIDYRHTTAEDIAAAGERFDVVLNMEVVEHVADPPAFLGVCRDLLVPGGLMVCSTINRNAKSYMVAIVGAEVVMRWLPPGTHEWSRFITPDELFEMLRGAGLEPVDRKGFVFNPLRWDWAISERDLSVNYVTASVRPG